MAIKALAEYDFPSADRPENFGDDMLVNVMWANNMMLCSAACFRAPRSDPDYDASSAGEWRLDGKPFTPQPDQSLDGLGVAHKGLITFQA
jgi:phenol hydroxylase P4 protein